MKKIHEGNLMKKHRQLITSTLILMLALSSVYGQEIYPQQEETYSPAYLQSSHTAHWSVYVPIALLVGSAIWFGFADQHCGHHSQDVSYKTKNIANLRQRPSNYLQGSYSHYSFFQNH